MTNVIDFTNYRRFKSVSIDAPVTKFNFVGAYFMVFSFIGVMLTAVGLFL